MANNEEILLKVLVGHAAGDGTVQVGSMTDLDRLAGLEPDDTTRALKALIKAGKVKKSKNRLVLTSVPVAEEPVTACCEVPLVEKTHAPGCEADRPVQAKQETSTPPAGGNIIKGWTLALAGSKLTASEKVLGMVIAQHADYRVGRVFIGSERLAEILGADEDKIKNSERKVKERRKKLKAHGWLVDTGERRGQSVVYQLTIPRVPN
ncbi:helix-turn-helix domain-containing protein [Streptomyces sp. NBC_00237]|uniref:hypothetical protein n=1 Tax=Streptomyces sp. NBC_00237 TaxID=2975687 RepID=UPI00225B3653|nr:hypothetical protein [Streptomyces sp. NBC_00237]MCX5203010.1 helix-turn-helix domain-containing protein [Streptomyces sp. NBC_00237]